MNKRIAQLILSLFFFFIVFSFLCSKNDLLSLLKTHYYVWLNKEKKTESGKSLESIKSMVLLDSGISDLTPLFRLNNLQSLTIMGKSLKSIEGVEKFRSLKKLDIGLTDVKDLSPLRRKTDLIELSIGSTPVKDLTPIKDMLFLEVVVIDHTDIASLSALKNMSNMKRFHANSCPKIKDINDLYHMKYLEELELDRVRNVDDFSLIENFIKLKRLVLSRTNFNHTMYLRNLIALEYLDLTETDVSETEPLSNLVNLQLLYLCFTKIDNIDPLSKLAKLKSLDIYGCKNIRYISSMKNLEKLEYFSAGPNILDKEDFKLKRRGALIKILNH